MSTEKRRIFLVNKPLTAGIEEVDATIYNYGQPDCHAKAKRDTPGRDEVEEFSQDDFSGDLVTAIDMANERLEAHRESLRRQLERIEGFQFSETVLKLPD